MLTTRRSEPGVGARRTGITAVTARYLIRALRTLLEFVHTRTPQDQEIAVGRRTTGATSLAHPALSSDQKDQCRRRRQGPPFAHLAGPAPDARHNRGRIDQSRRALPMVTASRVAGGRPRIVMPKECGAQAAI